MFSCSRGKIDFLSRVHTKYAHGSYCKREYTAQPVLLFVVGQTIIIIKFKNWVSSILPHKFWLIFIGMKQKEKFKINQLKKTEFFKTANSKIGSWFSMINQGLLDLDGRNSQKYLHQT